MSTILKNETIQSFDDCVRLFFLLVIVNGNIKLALFLQFLQFASSVTTILKLFTNTVFIDYVCRKINWSSPHAWKIKFYILTSLLSENTDSFLIDVFNLKLFYIAMLPKTGSDSNIP